MSTRMTSMGILTWFFVVFVTTPDYCFYLVESWYTIKELLNGIQPKLNKPWQYVALNDNYRCQVLRFCTKCSTSRTWFAYFTVFFLTIAQIRNVSNIKKTQIIRETRDVQWKRTLKRTKCIIIQEGERERKITHYLARLLQTCFY